MMCEECGCGTADSSGGHAHEHEHVGPDGRPYRHSHAAARGGAGAGTGTRTVRLAERVLARNDALAEENRAWLAQRGIVAINLISSPGSGKTLLLEKTLEGLRGEIACAVIAGDQQTDRDARRLSGRGASVVQIETRDACHLDAERVGAVLQDAAEDGTRLLFIENVGNLVCPAAFDLGESFKAALLSTAEGEDKPLKYPVLFANAQVAVITKIDLVPHLEWDESLCRESVQKVHPGIFTFALSARTGQGLDAWLAYLRSLVAR